jgi:hypothetical protein
VVNLSLLVKIGGSLFLLVAGAFINRLFERRPRLIVFYGHVGRFHVQPPQPPLSPQPGIVHTHWVVIRNAGRVAAQNVHVPHNLMGARLTFGLRRAGQAILPDRFRRARNRPKRTTAGTSGSPAKRRKREPVKVPFTPWERYANPQAEGDHRSDIGRANESPAGTGAPRTSEIDIGVSEDDLRVIAEHGYECAASTDAVSLITDMLAASIGQG